MYKINITLSENREIYMTSSSAGVTGENNSTELVFEIPKEYSGYTKYLDVFKENGEITQSLVSVSDEERFSYRLPGQFMEYLNIYMQLVLKKGTQVFKSYRFALTFEEGINATNYLESEYKDSIQELFERKTDKEETENLKNAIENKISFKLFGEEKKLLLDMIKDKADSSALPGKLSDLYDDTDKNFSVKYAENSKKSEESIKADHAKKSDEATKCSKDGRGNIIHETYAEKKNIGIIEIGNIESDEELKEYREPGLFSFSRNSLKEANPVSESNYNKGLLLNCINSFVNVTTGKGNSGLVQYIYYPDKGEVFIRTATHDGEDFWNAAADDYEWGRLELYKQLSEENFTNELYRKLNGLPSADAIATKEELSAAIGEALEGDY